ncbi:TetR/AcrR family transcriptional regulator [Actinophytocola oryzae]|uniref:TetR family transcriptional regulator n=1 Tax=Actinophytocola oryzae TaxID=502181 RepID=A0A4R7VCL8_9PSEU|nr:TetR/AcrR family transcriptional regulator [Actinophytocola oryzae]TDV46850.1 TetR family transcriptional regulator [Actinophytocola oryzae]
MSSDVNRAYRSPRRAEAARQTRQLIRDAAFRLFVEQGITVTTMRQIAAEAGVAERTVYTAFPSKIALFHEVMDIRTVGDELPVPVSDRAEFTASQSEPDPHEAVRQFVDFGCALLERVGDLIMAAIESSGADPDMREWSTRASDETSKNINAVAQAWKDAGFLRDDLTADEAGAAMYALSSPHVHHLLRRRQGWSVERYRTWVITTITTTMLS